MTPQQLLEFELLHELGICLAQTMAVTRATGDDMGAVFPMRFVILGLLLAATVVVSRGEEFCSLVVEVVGPNGSRPPSEVSVEAREQSGHVEAATTEGGFARICGLGISPVTVTVGADKHWCQAVVRDVPLEWSVSVHLKVMYDFDPCRYGNVDHVYGIANGVFTCHALLRVFDERGKDVPNVVLKSPQGATPDMLTDRYGRLLIAIRSDRGARLRTEISGFESTRIDLQCRAPGSVEEHSVILKRVP